MESGETYPDHVSKAALQHYKRFWINTSEKSALLVGFVQEIKFISGVQGTLRATLSNSLTLWLTIATP